MDPWLAFLHSTLEQPESSWVDPKSTLNLTSHDPHCFFLHLNYPYLSPGSRHYPPSWLPDPALATPCPSLLIRAATVTLGNLYQITLLYQPSQELPKSLKLKPKCVHRLTSLSRIWLSMTFLTSQPTTMLSFFYSGRTGLPAAPPTDLNVAAPAQPLPRTLYLQETTGLTPLSPPSQLPQLSPLQVINPF